ncbi:hypothetical protein Tco_0768390 [Tanacetum coccineum]
MVYVVNGVLGSGVDMLLTKDFVCLAYQEMKIHPLVLLILSMILQTFLPHPPQPQYESYSCELCGNDSHYGYDCLPRFSLVYEQEPSYNQKFSDNYYPQNSPSFSQQYLCCENCGGPHESFQCQPMNQNHFEHNSNSSGFDQYQSPQYSIDNQEDLNQQRWEESKNELLNMMRSFCKMVIQRKQAANIDQSPPQEMCTLEPS